MARIIYDLGDGYGIEIELSTEEVVNSFVTTFPGKYGVDVKNISTEIIGEN